MTILNLQIAATNQDGYEYGPNTTWVEGGFDSDGDGLGANIGPHSNCDVGLVFDGVTIPQGATINSATLEIYVTWIGADANLLPIRIKGFAADNTPVFASNGSDRPSTRTKTTANVAQTLGTVSAGAWKSLNSITTIIQEIVSRSGWASGNRLGLVIEEENTGAEQRLQVQDYGRNATYGVKLSIDYTAGGGVTVEPAAAVAKGAVAAPTVVYGALVVSPSPVVAKGAVVDPIVVYGSLVVSTATATARGAVVDPTVIGGGVMVEPAAAVAKGAVVDPIVVYGPLVVSPAAATARGAVVKPTVIGGGVLNPLGEGDSPGFVVFMLASSIYHSLEDAGLAGGLSEPDESNYAEWGVYLFGE